MITPAQPATPRRLAGENGELGGENEPLAARELLEDEMQTKQQIEQAFRAELQALLDKYGAELEAKDHYQGYAECGEDVRMTVDIPSIWDNARDCLVREYTEIDLGSHLWPTPNARA